MSMQIQAPPFMRRHDDREPSNAQLVIPKPYAPWQHELINSDCKLQVYALGTKSGKAVSVYEPIATPNGWVTMGDLKEGDYVFDEQGRPTLITYATDVMFDHECYRVEFSDGNSVVVDAGHLWVTSTHLSRRNFARYPEEKHAPKIITTADILKTLETKVGGKTRLNHAVKNVTAPVQFTNKVLPLDPYLLGVWIGDGWTNSGGLSLNSEDPEILQGVRASGWEVRAVPSCDITWRIVGLTVKLKELNLLGNKHIPKEYLVSDYADRLALVQGLMDTDGTADKKGHCTFYSTLPDVADAVCNLLESFGIKVIRDSKIGKLYGVEHKRCYQLHFTTDLPVFRTQRKAARQRTPSIKTYQRHIAKVTPVESVPVRCIMVDSPTHLFLVGRAFIPTHNTIAAACRIIKRSFLKTREQDALLRIVAPYLRQSAITFRYINRLVPPKLRMTDNLPEDVALDAVNEWERFTLERSEQRRTMTWPHNDARIECCHTQDPEANEGDRVSDQVFDEASKAKEQAFASIMSTTTQTGGSTVLCSTPKGKGWFYKVAMECREEEAWAIAKGIPPTKIFRTVPTWTSPFVSQEVIENARKTLPDRLFRQLYGAEFVDDGSVFTELAQAFLNISDFEMNDFKILENHDSKAIYVGVDWAKSHDFTVMTALNENGLMIGYRRIQKVSYPQQVQMMYDFLDACVTNAINKGRQLDTGDVYVLHDGTGVGAAIDDVVTATNLKGWAIDPIVWNNSNKEVYVNDLILSLEEHRLTLLPWHYLQSELKSFEIETSATGKPIYGAPEGMHDDTVMSLVLSNKLFREHSTQIASRPMVIDTLRNQIETIYYYGDADDD